MEVEWSGGGEVESERPQGAVHQPACSCVGNTAATLAVQHPSGSQAGRPAVLQQQQGRRHCAREIGCVCVERDQSEGVVPVPAESRENERMCEWWLPMW